MVARAHSGCLNLAFGLQLGLIGLAWPRRTFRVFFVRLAGAMGFEAAMTLSWAAFFREQKRLLGMQWNQMLGLPSGLLQASERF